MQEHDQPGQAGEVLHVTDDALRERDDEHGGPGARGVGAGGGQAHGDDHRDDQTDEQHHRVGVDPGDRARVEAEAGRLVGVAGVRARTGDEGAEQQHDDGERGDALTEPPDAGSHDELGGGVALPAAPDQPSRRRDQQHRDEEVRRDDRGVEPGEHGDATDDRLQCDAGQHQAGRQAQALALRRADDDADEQRQRHDAEHAGEGAVAELDVLVPTLLLVPRGRERVGRAAGPFGATQARAGQSHQTPGHHDADLAGEIEPEQRRQPLRQRPRRQRRQDRTVGRGEGVGGGHVFLGWWLSGSAAVSRTSRRCAARGRSPRRPTPPEPRAAAALLPASR